MRTGALSADERKLAELGDKQELNRGWSGFSNFAISLTIICILRTAGGMGCVAASSRMVFAFSRDGAVPGHNLWRRLSANRTPTWSALVPA